MTEVTLNQLVFNGCDTHVHVIGDPDSYPMVSERRYTPGIASVEDLLQHLKIQQLNRVVIVQPSVYGTDNQCMVDALSVLGSSARGVAVLAKNISSQALLQLDQQGVRGVRLNFESTSNHNTNQLKESLEFWAPRLEPLGWHIQVYAPFDVVCASANSIARLPIPVVLDHFALWPQSSADIPNTEIISSLLVQGCIYIKLSASYRSASYSEESLKNLAHRLLELRPDRILWASDWPHTNREPGVGPFEVSRYRDVNPQQLIRERFMWLRTQELTRQVLVNNPSHLYSF